jgi:regulator of RNase E activity RraA
MTANIPDIKNLCSGLFSDNLDKMGLRQQIASGFSRNQKILRFIGRARTVLLETIETPDENINLGLSFLGSLKKGDVLIVAGSGKFAYFGEMMSRLSIRQGIEGVVIDGMTRDSVFTHDECSLQIVSKGYTPVDIKGRGRVQAVDAAVIIGGITVEPHDLIFVDNDAVCIVPKNAEQELWAMIEKDIAEEKRIVDLISSCVSVEDLLKQVKSF